MRGTAFDGATSRVREQYDRFPYPPRDPGEDRTRLLATVLDDLDTLNVHCFRGRRNFHEGFRALIAGGGTGDATVYLAHQLRGTNAEIVHIDLSDNSLQIARQRADSRNLAGRIEWIRGSLLDLPEMGLGRFDYINCSGVLHHLEKPAEGLAALRSVLADDGAMGLMLYGLHGRTGVYQIQELLRTVCGDESEPQNRLDAARKIVAALPATNWFQRGADLFLPLEDTGDAELFDMFLHSQDVGFSMPEVYRLLDGAGLHLAEFTLALRALYQPASLGQNPALQSRVQRLPRPAQHAVAELYWGAMTTHSFWATAQPCPRIDLDDLDNIPFFSRIGELQHVRDSILNCDGDVWRFGMQTRRNVNLTVGLSLDLMSRRIVELIDGRRTLGHIEACIAAEKLAATSHVAANPKRPADEIRRRCKTVVETLLGHDLLLLRHKSVPPTKKSDG